MQKLILLVCLSGFTVPAMASCDDVKAKLEAKIQANGIKEYTLEVQPVKSASAANAAASSVSAASGVSSTKTSAGKVIGTCEGGSKQILYIRF